MPTGKGDLIMSTLAYAALTTKRSLAMPDTSSSTQAPGVSTWVDSLASLVPAEVLAVHGALLAVLTAPDKAGGTIIVDAPTLTGVFYALIVVSMLLYAGSRVMAHLWDRLDYVRILIPPLAFVGWTMLQRATAFDAAFPGVSSGLRTTIALIGAVLLGLVAAMLAYRADQSPPPK
jgi:hypothetical protein